MTEGRKERKEKKERNEGRKLVSLPPFKKKHK